MAWVNCKSCGRTTPLPHGFCKTCMELGQAFNLLDMFLELAFNTNDEQWFNSLTKENVK